MLTRRLLGDNDNVLKIGVSTYSICKKTNDCPGVNLVAEQNNISACIDDVPLSGNVSLPNDIARFHSLGLLDTLLHDRTSGQNIIWATDAFAHLGEGFTSKDAITKEAITGENAQVIRRRSVKNDDEKSVLTRIHAEVFTPSWVVKLMVDAADAAWSEGERRSRHSDGWQKYVASPRLEITCGEAPFLVNRYDAAEGTATPLENRTGILSRKLAFVNEHTKTRATWMKWATIALQSVYGYEFQGDNLLIARVNVLCTMEDYLKAAGYEAFTQDEYAYFAEIVSWNLWQMDGLTNCVPFGKAKKDAAQKSIFDLLDDSAEEEQFGDCIIFDWKHERQIEFASIRKGSDMKFDYIIGNPPYQEETESESTRMPPIYNHFMDQCYEVADKVELITPARFLFDAGYTPHDWNEKMLNDAHFKVLHYEPRSGSIFPNTDIKGGIVITYRNAKKNFGSIGIFTSFEELNNILGKVKSANPKHFLSEIIYPALSYQLSDLMKKENQNSLHRLRTSAFDKLSEIFFIEEPDDGHEYIQMLGLKNGKREYRYIRRDYIKVPDNFESFKIILPKSNGSGALGEVLSTPLIGAPLIGAPLIGHTQTFISIGKFETEEEAQACLKYIKTKFARVLLGVLKITQDNPAPKWKYVPLQDFTSSSDIDWSQSVAEIDVQLYKKYGLSPEEIDFIETHVKDMS